MTKIYESLSAEETQILGERLGAAAAPGEVYALDGDLGVGKTAFAQGFARGLGITEPVSSPTFTILQEYDMGRLPLYHFDVYRIADPSELDEIGYDEYISGQGVCLIEWAELIADELPADAYRILIEKEPERGFDYRCITVRHKD